MLLFALFKYKTKTKNDDWQKVTNEIVYWSTKSRNSDVFCKLKWPRMSEIKWTQIYLRFLFLLLTKRKKKNIPQFCWWVVLCQLWLIGIANGALGQFVSTVILRPLPALICANTPGKIYNLFTFPLLIKSFLIVDWLYFKIVLSSHKAAGQAYAHKTNAVVCTECYVQVTGCLITVQVFLARCYLISKS